MFDCHSPEGNQSHRVRKLMTCRVVADTVLTTLGKITYLRNNELQAFTTCCQQCHEQEGVPNARLSRLRPRERIARARKLPILADTADIADGSLYWVFRGPYTKQLQLSSELSENGLCEGISNGDRDSFVRTYLRIATGLYRPIREGGRAMTEESQERKVLEVPCQLTSTVSASRQPLETRHRTTGDLTDAQRLLLRIMMEHRFGRLENLPIQDGQPVLDRGVKVVRVARLGGKSGGPNPASTGEFDLKQEVCDLFDELARLRYGEIIRLEFRHGLPVLLETTAGGVAEDPPTASMGSNGFG